MFSDSYTTKNKITLIAMKKANIFDMLKFGKILHYNIYSHFLLKIFYHFKYQLLQK